MIIGFDAKRAFQNFTGLGNYSRGLILSLHNQFPQIQFDLYAPKVTDIRDAFNQDGFTIHAPQSTLHRKFPAVWRSKWVSKDIEKNNTDLYHGLSFELPMGLGKKVKQVVSVHDLIFERFPRQYNFADTIIHRNKTKHACNQADMIFAMSKQTKNDLIEFYKIPENKIQVTYQSCDTSFERQGGIAHQESVRATYNLPEQYYLTTGSIIERKDLLTIIKAIELLPKDLQLPLVVIGSTTGFYTAKVKKYVQEKGLNHKVIFLNDLPVSTSSGFRSGEDLPNIYQMATAFLYASTFEGFGIPILEALWSHVPVVCSNISSMPEVSADAALYFTPGKADEMAAAIEKIMTDTNLRREKVDMGLKQAEKFRPNHCAQEVMKLYRQLN